MTRWLRWVALAWGMAVLAWLPVEDTGVGSVIVLASLGGGLAGAGISLRYAAAWGGEPHYFLMRSVLTGGLAGLLVSPLGLMLMALKTGAHGHVAADFTRPQIALLMARTPVFLAGGLLIGLGIGLWRLARCQQ